MIINAKPNEAIIKYHASATHIKNNEDNINNNEEPFDITETASIKKSEAKYIYNRNDYS
mgnify:CR=1 FL=1|jgi:hypothetical protein